METSFNSLVAGLFRDCAMLLQDQNASPFRVNAYLRAAETLETLDTDVRRIMRKDGAEGLRRLPRIGHGLASAIEEIARTGHMAQLDRIRGETSPERIFETVPGIGETLARMIHDELEIETLDQLEIAANSGLIEQVSGIGRRRVAAIKAGVNAILQRHGNIGRPAAWAPDVEMLLDVDREYRQRAAAGELRLIAPRRLNPEKKAWLPIMHTAREHLHFTALYSNTARAHGLDKTHDWVVIYYYDDEHREGQCTVVTETRGAPRGKRVVRGREAECRRQKFG